MQVFLGFETFNFPLNDQKLIDKYNRLVNLDAEYSNEYNIKTSSSYQYQVIIAEILKQYSHEDYYKPILISLMNEYGVLEIEGKLNSRQLKIVNEDFYYIMLITASGFNKFPAIAQRHFNLESFKQEFENSFEVRGFEIPQGSKIETYHAIFKRNGLEKQPFDVDFNWFKTWGRIWKKL